MEWSVAKTGAEMFDALHAYGLGILVANATGSAVQLQDDGILYGLSSTIDVVMDANPEILDTVLALPTAEHIEEFGKTDMSVPVSIANLDGLLAALFTTPGVRLVSVMDLLSRQRLDPEAVDKALKKVNTAIVRWKKSLKRLSQSATWLSALLQHYDARFPTPPTPAKSIGNAINVPMTLDPAFSYSTRRLLSDGLVTEKCNLSVFGTLYAPLLAFIGAARFLRGQRVANELVNYYLPLPAMVVLEAGSALPLLQYRDCPAEQAIVAQWLAHKNVVARCSHLAYQILQTQGAQQSISRGRGCLDVSWLMSIEERAGPSLVDYWQWLLRQCRERIPFEIDELVDCLLNRRGTAWVTHLREVAMYLSSNPETGIRPYGLQELREVSIAMNDLTNAPLRTVLDREKGTLRFGHALRLLGQYNHGVLRDIVDELSTLRTSDQLIRCLAYAVQECAVASAKSEFIIVPCDEDLGNLLEDVDQHGVQTIAGLLIILSVLRYPRRSSANDGADAQCDGGDENES